MRHNQQLENMFEVLLQGQLQNIGCPTDVEILSNRQDEVDWSVVKKKQRNPGASSRKDDRRK